MTFLGTGHPLALGFAKGCGFVLWVGIFHLKTAWNPETTLCSFPVKDGGIIFFLSADPLDPYFVVHPANLNGLVSGRQRGLLERQAMIGEVKHSGLGPTRRVVFGGVELK